MILRNQNEKIKLDFLCAEVCDNIKGEVPKRICDHWKNKVIMDNWDPI